MSLAAVTTTSLHGSDVTILAHLDILGIPSYSSQAPSDLGCRLESLQDGETSMDLQCRMTLTVKMILSGLFPIELRLVFYPVERSLICTQDLKDQPYWAPGEVTNQNPFLKTAQLHQTSLGCSKFLAFWLNGSNLNKKREGRRQFFRW